MLVIGPSFVSSVNLYLMLSFVMNKALSYTRLLLILPFVVYFVVRGLDILASHLAERARSEAAPRLYLHAPAYCVALIAVWNLYIYGDFAARGLINGHGIGLRNLMCGNSL